MKNIGILMGGPSAEREVSLNSGENVYNALLNSKKYHPVKIIVSLNKEWKTTTGSLIDPKNHLADGKKIDGVYNALHGKYGEDGELQKYLEGLNISYTGSDSASSKLGMDKESFKAVLRNHDIKQADFKVLIKNKSENASDFRKNYKKVVVKPCCEGSSLGVSIANTTEELKKGIEEAFKYDNSIIVEEFIDGREFSCGILGNNDLTALPPIEIIPKNDFFDYESKYEEGFCEEICPANISEEEDMKIREVSLDVYNAIGCKGLARVDVFLTKDGEVYVIEINTSPGMTNTSLLPKEANAAGINFLELVEKVIDLSLE